MLILACLSAMASNAALEDVPSVANRTQEEVVALSQVIVLGTVEEVRYVEFLTPVDFGLGQHVVVSVSQELHGSISSGRVAVRLDNGIQLPEPGETVLVYGTKVRWACVYSGCSTSPRLAGVPYYSDMIGLAIAGSMFVYRGGEMVSLYALPSSWDQSPPNATGFVDIDLSGAADPVTLTGLEY